MITFCCYEAVQLDDDKKIPIFLCTACRINLTAFYTFKKTLLKCYNRWRKYVSDLKHNSTSGDHKYTNLKVSLIDIKHTHNQILLLDNIEKSNVLSNMKETFNIDESIKDEREITNNTDLFKKNLGNTNIMDDKIKTELYDNNNHSNDEYVDNQIKQTNAVSESKIKETVIENIEYDSPSDFLYDMMYFKESRNIKNDFQNDYTDFKQPDNEMECTSNETTINDTDVFRMNLDCYNAAENDEANVKTEIDEKFQLLNSLYNIKEENLEISYDSNETILLSKDNNGSLYSEGNSSNIKIENSDFKDDYNSEILKNKMKSEEIAINKDNVFNINVDIEIEAKSNINNGSMDMKTDKHLKLLNSVIHTEEENLDISFKIKEEILQTIGEDKPGNINVTIKMETDEYLNSLHSDLLIKEESLDIPYDINDEIIQASSEDNNPENILISEDNFSTDLTNMKPFNKVTDTRNDFENNNEGDANLQFTQESHKRKNQKSETSHNTFKIKEEILKTIGEDKPENINVTIKMETDEYLNSLHNELLIKEESLDIPFDIIDEIIQTSSEDNNPENILISEDNFSTDLTNMKPFNKVTDTRNDFENNIEGDANLQFTQESHKRQNKKSKTSKSNNKMNSKSEDENKICPICNKTFVSKAHVNRHIESIHSKRYKYTCDICNKKFCGKDQLKNHVKIHNKPYNCTICDKQFSQNSHLNNHLNIHSDNRQFKCEVCSKTFIQKSNYITHVRIHTGEKPFSCTFCEKRFVSSNDMMRHKRIHTQDFKHTCSVCDKQFNEKSKLKRHLKVHQKKKRKE